MSAATAPADELGTLVEAEAFHRARERAAAYELAEDIVRLWRMRHLKVPGLLERSIARWQAMQERAAQASRDRHRYEEYLRVHGPRAD